MKVEDLLLGSRIRIPVAGPGLDEALHELAGSLVDEAASGEVDAIVASVLQETNGGELLHFGEFALAIAGSEQVPSLAAALGVRRDGILLPTDPDDPAEVEVRALVLLVTPRRPAALKLQAIPVLGRFLRSEDIAKRVIQADSPEEVRAIDDLMRAELSERLLVGDAMVPVSYRVYPDTPVAEIVDLMSRRGVRTIPVVGERYEVLGLVSQADVMRHLLPRRRSGEGEGSSEEGDLTARDVMSRSVMCVSEDQNLLEAANMMVNRDVEQLPVVREGELVGMLGRERILRLLFGQAGGGQDEATLAPRGPEAGAETAANPSNRN